MSVELMHIVPGASCIAFEPQQQLAAAVANSIRLNGLGSRVRIIECALGHRTGPAILQRYSHDGHAAIANDSETDGGREGRVQVDCLTLDQAIEDFALPAPDLLKIDVEGNEELVLAGAMSVLAQTRPSIVFECARPEQGRRIASILARVGDYRYYYARGSYRPLKAFSFEAAIDGKTDVLAVEGSRLPSLPEAFRH